MGHAIDFVIHLDKHIEALVQACGPWSYLVLFLIIFFETACVVTPILPGDSLLFAAGALATRGLLNVWVLLALLVVAAISGDAVNYFIGNFFGARLLAKPRRFLKQEHLLRTQRFFERYGPKTIVIARFAPIVRTFAPFMAGIGQMSYRRFATYNVMGGVLWIGSFVIGGYAFGNLPWVKRNFTLLIAGIIVVSLAPAVFEFWRARKSPARDSSADAITTPDKPN